MSKIQRNQKCPCGSGKKYKYCCNKEPLRGTRISFLGRDEISADDLGGKLLKETTGYGPNDYMNPVRYFSDKIYSIFSDESYFKGHYCVSLIIMKFDNNAHNSINRKLNKLVEKYEIDTIHFTDIFSGKQLGMKRDSFLNEYIEIVSNLDLTCLAMSETKETIDKMLGVANLTDEQRYHNMFWMLMDTLISDAKDDYILNIWKEQENNFTPKHTMDLHTKLGEGIKFIMQKHSDKYVSICRYPSVFMKSELLMSSLSDLIAYTVNKVQNKIDKGVPIKKIEKEYKVSLVAIKKIFNNYKSIGSRELVSLVTKV